MADLLIEWHGSIVLLYPSSDAGESWLDIVEQGAGDVQHYGAGLVVEPRYLRDLVVDAIDNGLEVRGGTQ